MSTPLDPQADTLPTEFLEISDVARLLGIEARSVTRRVQAGLLPIAATTPRGTRLFRRADVEALRARAGERRR